MASTKQSQSANTQLIPTYDLLDASVLSDSTNEFSVDGVLREVFDYENSNGDKRVSFVLSFRNSGSRDPQAQLQANFSYSWRDMTREQVAYWRDAAKKAKGKLKVTATFEITAYLGGKPQLLFLATR